jgi:hypothetical protein
MKDSKHVTFWILFPFMLVVFPALGFLLAAGIAGDLGPEKGVPADARLITSPPQSAAASSHPPTPISTAKSRATAMEAKSAAEIPCSPSSMLFEPFYGMEFVPIEDLSMVKDLGIEVVLMSFEHDRKPVDWLAYLDAAQGQGIWVIPWLWPEGWTWDGSTWQIDAQAELFLQTVAGHPALFAVYALHEPYWNGCEGCGYTTAEQQALYSAIKAIADVPIYSEINGIAWWTAHSQATAFADGVCDYCQSSYFPFLDGGVYLRDELIAAMTEDLAVARERAPNSKIVWTMPTLVYPPDNFRMPTADEMRDHAAIVYSMDVAGAWWYPWKFEGHYDDVLFNHPEIYPVVREVYEEYVLPAKDVHCLYLPIMYRDG